MGRDEIELVIVMLFDMVSVVIRMRIMIMMGASKVEYNDDNGDNRENGNGILLLLLACHRYGL